MPPFPNPDTYLNHLTPEAGARFEGVRNLCLAVLGVRFFFHVCDFLKELTDTYNGVGDDMG